MGIGSGRPVYRSALFEGSAPTYYQSYGRRPEGLLSREERKNLLIAIGALTLALTMVMFGGGRGLLIALEEDPLVVGIIALVALASTGTGFAMHELAHKFVAQRYRCWAEFRYSLQGLVLALGMAGLVGFLFAAPGAVYIVGRIDERENGHISIAGPLTNVAVAVGMLPLVLMGGLIGSGAFTVAYFNIFLAVFNMIPIMPLDGSKVLKWNVGVYAAALAGMGALFAYIWFFLEIPF
jgi:Zn-dependent protease